MMNRDQRDLKAKVQNVREVLGTGISNNDIGLVLQHFDYNIELTVAAFLDGQSESIIRAWSKTNKKTNADKKKARKSQTSQVQVNSSTLYGSGTIVESSRITSAHSGWNTSHSIDSDISVIVGSSSGLHDVIRSTSGLDFSLSSASSQSSDSRSVASDSGAAASINSEQTIDSGIESGSGLPERACCDLKDEDFSSTGSNREGKELRSAVSATINECFKILQDRLEERRSTLLWKLKNINEESESLCSFTCNLKHVLNAIDSFGQVVRDLSNVYDGTEVSSSTKTLTEEDKITENDSLNDPAEAENLSENLEINSNNEKSVEQNTEQTVEIQKNSLETKEGQTMQQDQLSPEILTVNKLSTTTISSPDLPTSYTAADLSHPNNKPTSESIQKKQSKVKDRRSKKAGGVPTSSSRANGVVEVSIDDFIHLPKKNSNPAENSASSNENKSQTKQQDIAYKDYVFQQSESLSRYERELSRGNSKPVKT